MRNGERGSKKGEESKEWEQKRRESSRYCREVMGTSEKTLWGGRKKKLPYCFWDLCFFHLITSLKLECVLQPMASEYWFWPGGSFDVVFVPCAQTLPLLSFLSFTPSGKIKQAPVSKLSRMGFSGLNDNPRVILEHSSDLQCWWQKDDIMKKKFKW